MKKQINFLEETREILELAGVGENDIIYIGSDPIGNPPYYVCNWWEFEALADFEYDNGFGSAQIARDLVMLAEKKGTYTIFSRNEYDGSEWWEYRTTKVPDLDSCLPLKFVKPDSGYDSTLLEIHNSDEY